MQVTHAQVFEALTRQWVMRRELLAAMEVNDSQRTWVKVGKRLDQLVDHGLAERAVDGQGRPRWRLTERAASAVERRERARRRQRA